MVEHFLWHRISAIIVVLLLRDMLKLSGFELGVLTKMLTSHAYREKLGIERFRQAVDMATLPREKAYFRLVVEEEETHFRGCLEVAAETGIHLEELINARMRKEPPGIPPFHTWLDVLLTHTFIDQAGYFVLQGLTQSSIDIYANVATRLIEDEQFHGMKGSVMLIEYFKKLDGRDPGTVAALHNHLGAAARCIGKPNSHGDAEAVRLHLKTRSAAETLNDFCQFADGILKKLSLENLTPLAKKYLPQSATQPHS